MTGEHGPELVNLPPGSHIIEAAMRWAVKAHIDASICDPCKKNRNKTYRNRASAYADYPGGSGYIKCVGAEYGNKCRCKVVKRRASK